MSDLLDKTIHWRQKGNFGPFQDLQISAPKIHLQFVGMSANWNDLSSADMAWKALPRNRRLPAAERISGHTSETKATLTLSLSPAIFSGDDVSGQLRRSCSLPRRHLKSLVQSKTFIVLLLLPLLLLLKITTGLHLHLLLLCV